MVQQSAQIPGGTVHSQLDSSILVRTSGLTKRYGRTLNAVLDLNMEIRRGEVYGFLGPNGAGKTTTLRMLLGLIKPTSGSANVLSFAPGDPRGLAQIGALVETPAFYPYLSGRDNLRVIARYTQIPYSRVDEVLKQVDLYSRGKDKFKGYSLGMKQRLGVAAALLKDPDLMILDEPTNGLDPRGMAEMRDLIVELGRGERTVLLSSHLLGEVEQICSRVGIIQQGRMIKEGPVSELRSQSGVLVRANPVDRAMEIARDMAGADSVQMDGELINVGVEPERAAELNYKLVSAGVEVSELRHAQRSLEQVFLQLTEEKVEATT